VITAKTKAIKVCCISSFNMLYDSFKLMIVMLCVSGCHSGDCMSGQCCVGQISDVQYRCVYSKSTLLKIYYSKGF
jgi:hypothetical protein